MYREQEIGLFPSNLLTIPVVFTLGALFVIYREGYCQC